MRGCRQNLRFLANTTAQDRSRSLASVNETSLLGLVSLDSVRARPSNTQRCRVFPFALPGLFLLRCCLRVLCAHSRR